MPYFAWVGITISGITFKGRLFARSIEDLERVLYKKEIGLIKARALQVRVKAETKAALIAHLASLLRAHLKIHTALATLRTTIIHPYVRMVIEDIESALKEGSSFSAAVRYHDLFDDLFKAIITTGEKTGNMPQALEYLSHYTHTLEQLRAKLRAALLSPLLTGAFFIMVMIIVFIFVIPRFEYFFSSFQEPIPPFTRAVISLSHALSSFYFFCALIGIATGIRIISSNKLMKQKGYKLSLKIPGISYLLILSLRAHFLHMLALLLKGGIPLAQALQVCKDALKSSLVHESLSTMKKEIEKGNCLSMGLRKTILSCPEAEALIELGESSGELTSMIYQAALLEEQKLYHYLRRLSSLVQPLLLLLLGILIAGLIFALYMPLLTLSTVIQ